MAVCADTVVRAARFWCVDAHDIADRGKQKMRAANTFSPTDDLSASIGSGSDILDAGQIMGQYNGLAGVSPLGNINWVNSAFPPSNIIGASGAMPGSTSQLVQAMAGFASPNTAGVVSPTSSSPIPGTPGFSSSQANPDGVNVLSLPQIR